MRYVEISPRSVEVRESSPAPLTSGEARVKVLGCGICGTDVELMRGMVLPRGVEYPVCPGHEVAGEVVEVADDVDPAGDIAVGKTVVLHPLAACGKCEACERGDDQLCRSIRLLGFHTPGGLAEEVVWPADRMVDAGDLPATTAALLADAVATAYHALGRADLKEDEAVCVLGAGGVGTQVLRLIRLLHPTSRVAAVVRTDASAERVRSFGATAVQGLDGAAARVRDAIGRVDCAIDFTGDAQGVPAGVRMLRPGGRLVVGSVADYPASFGTTVTGLSSREIDVRGTYISTMDDLRAVTMMARDGRLDLTDAVTSTMPFDEASDALRLVAEHPPGLQRLVLTPNGATA